MPNRLTGQTLLARYRVDEFIGRGGMADVYRVHDLRRAVPLAIKVLRPDLIDQAHLTQRFAQEAELLGALTHPHIVRFYEWHSHDDLMFIVMDYVAGSNLRQVLQSSNRPLGAAAILAYYRPITAAVFFAHQKPVYHCDLKPSNILIASDTGSVFVSDFGVARITAEGGVLGTATHMAPEQVVGESIDARTDIYALGVMLFELATGGNRPFSGDSQHSTGSTPEERIAWQHINQTPPSPRQFCPSISARLEAVILRALQKTPDERFATSLELLEALEAAAHQESARPVPHPGRSSHQARTQPPANTTRSTPNPPAPLPPVAPSKPARPSGPRAQPPAPQAQPQGRAAPSSSAPPLLRGVKAYLSVRLGAQPGPWIPITADPWIIGRSRECQLALASPRVSRRHAEIRSGKGYYFVRDLNSTLGTYVNGRRVSAQAIRSGDLIQMGDITLEFRENG